jgi:hypothetical protein
VQAGVVKKKKKKLRQLSAQRQQMTQVQGIWWLVIKPAAGAEVDSEL